MNEALYVWTVAWKRDATREAAATYCIIPRVLGEWHPLFRSEEQAKRYFEAQDLGRFYEVVQLTVAPDDRPQGFWTNTHVVTQT